LKALKTIAKVAAKMAPGRLPSFAEAHVVEALEDISILGTVGRLELSRGLELGEGETRTLIKHLRNEGLIDVSRRGISLSGTGRELLSSLRTVLSKQVEVPLTPLTVGRFNVAVRVAHMKNFVKYGLEQRDAAITAGAKGATTLVFTKKELVIPGTGEKVSETGSLVVAALIELGLEEGDVVIVGSADAKMSAELGAKTAALELLKTKDRTDSKRSIRPA
jgi:hypothetical protein